VIGSLSITFKFRSF